MRDGGVWTSAGITPAIDLTLALVEEHHGRGVAMAVARRLMLFLRRSGNEGDEERFGVGAVEGRAFVDPAPDQGGLRRGQWIVLLRHAIFLFLCGHAAEQFALLGVPWHDRGGLAFAGFEQPIKAVEAEVAFRFLRTVAGDAFGCQHRGNIVAEADGRRPLVRLVVLPGRRCGDREQSENDDGCRTTHWTT